MIGIYKYTNKINNKSYIGQSIDIERRQKAHLYSAYNEKACDYNVVFHQAIRKYGIENFNFEILTEVEPENYSINLLNELEKFYIQFYNSYSEGYNSTLGGENCFGDKKHLGSTNGRALLTEEDVYYIRECYNSHIPFKTVYEEYKDKISKRGLQKIWWFDTWKHILPEYHNEENKYWHSHNAKSNNSEIAKNNKRKFSDVIIKNMIQDYDNGITAKEIQNKYAPDTAYSIIYNIVTRKTYKDIQ